MHRRHLATLAVLIITNSVLIGARPLTRGSQTFYGVPRLTTLWLALAVACAFVAIARVLRDMPFGLALRAARDDEVAAVSIGVEIGRGLEQRRREVGAPHHDRVAHRAERDHVHHEPRRPRDEGVDERRRRGEDEPDEPGPVAQAPRAARRAGGGAGRRWRAWSRSA